MTSFHLPPEASGLVDCDPYNRAMLAHDIRNALSGVTGGIALVGRARIEPGLIPQLDRILAAGEELGHLVAAALGESGGSGPEGTGDAATTRLPALLDTVGRRWKGEAAARSREFRIETGPDLPGGLRVPALDLLRILGNLIDSALRRGDGGIVRLVIRREADGGILLAVSAGRTGGRDGAGSPDASGQHRDHGTEGDGIGLHIAHKLTERAGGSLRLADPSTSGAGMILRLPPALAIEEPGGPEREAAELTAAGAEADPAVDRAAFDALVAMIGPEMMPELLDRIESDVASARDALAGAIDPPAVEVIRAKSHILISVAGSFGATRLQHAATALNAAARDPAAPGLGDQVRACLAEIAAALEFVRAERTAC